MRASVIKAYTDKATSEVHFAGEIVELTDARAKELAAGGFVEPQKAAGGATKAKASTKAATNRKGR